LAVTALFTACENDINMPSTSDESSTSPRAVYSSRTVNWNNRSDGTYTQSEAVTDFGNIGGWNEDRIINSNGTTRVKLEKNLLSNEGGVIARIDITDGSEYELQYDVKYHSQFDWSRGGKVGFGFKIGDGNSGCDKADDGNGGSARLMWYTDNNGVTKFKPYIYYKDMPGQCGHDFGKTYPASGSIQRGTWYTVKLYVKSNTGSNYNGKLKITIDGTTVIDKTNIRWTTNDAKRLINEIPFTSFRGGSTSNWESSTDGLIYYDNLSWTKIN
ncbi:MAG TPA: heparin lyase I family protein, partial [Pelobium sp.]|nr:heparin lyase I family protein [Pelobium sp.]